MTINRNNYYNWQTASKVDAVKFRKASPNMEALKDYLIKRYGGVSVGIYSNRNQRGGDRKSSHAYGAALDWRYPSRAVALKVMKLLVNYSQEFGVQMIVDYVGSTVWTPKNGWRSAKPDSYGMGSDWAKWLHIETTKSDWGNKKPIADR